MYIYGGYEVNEGILSDFYSMIIKNSKQYKWDKIIQKNVQKPYPGPLMRHTAVIFKDKMYIFGGNKQSMKSSNDIWTYDLINDEWEILEPKDGIKPPQLDSHCATVDDTRAFMYIFGGFSDQKDSFGGYQNSLWQFNFDFCIWQDIGEQSKIQPCKRSGACITILGQKIYMFGGTVVDIKFNDIWKFDIHQKEWEQIQIQKNQIQPETRNGHSLINYKDNLIVFGGIHDITHEKNDMYVFSPNDKQWHIIDDDTSHQQKKEQDSIIQSSNVLEKNNQDKSIVNELSLNTSIFKTQDDQTIKNSKNQKTIIILVPKMYLRKAIKVYQEIQIVIQQQLKMKLRFKIIIKWKKIEKKRYK
ncbi:kelch motif family protein, putative [Ichthyophthirius multifiliis]|uniref:Kelch motif family protein, putative n=1 Tax=Ichthyophthirius multifiliis TaxID=5932 RepID=G0R269_ICHMU|nr:kelch motif family protein, putative [Ichthyophthirius multifiliis]EGR28436.1 kelch motif family protein, putative [Ichthyophthirius multifiliis]|eukprot:XP_004029672.1 kelch motif family protein, putative [Ichthyophthirius multifiliis]